MSVIANDILRFVQELPLRYVPSGNGITAKVSYEQWKGEDFLKCVGLGALTEEDILASGQSAKLRLAEKLHAARRAVSQIAVRHLDSNVGGKPFGDPVSDDDYVPF